MTAKLSKLNQSVEKVLQIIEIMAHERQPMRLQDVAAGCGMPASTVLRMLNTLLVYGYVNQDPHSLRYSLSLKFAQIGSRVCEQVSLRDIVHPLLAELSRECREASCLAIEEDMEVVYTDVVDGPDSMLKIMQRIGKRAPMHSTGIGKLLLLNYSEEQLDEYIAAKGLPALTPNTLVTKQALAAKLEEIRGQGYALDDEECELGPLRGRARSGLYRPDRGRDQHFRAHLPDDDGAYPGGSPRGHGDGGPNLQGPGL